MRHKYSISAICKVLKINRSILYYKQKEKPLDITLETKIKQIFDENRKAYGTRKIKYKLAEDGIVVSRRRISKIMQKLGLVSCYIKHRPRQKKVKCNEDNCPNLLNREFDRDNTLDVVVSDLTYVSVAGKWHYICLLIDLWNREIIGWSVGRYKNAELVKQAFYRISYPLSHINIFHTDRGNEFKNKVIDEVITSFDIKRSLSKKGTPLDNAVIESTNHILKTEFVYQNRFQTLAELETKLFDYVHWYNNIRIHGSIGYVTPIAYRQTHAF